MNININQFSNRVDNMEEVLKYINESEISEDFINALKTMKNALESRNFVDKDKIVEAINKRVIEYEMSLDNQNKNKEAIELLQRANEDFKKLGIIATEPDKNDSNKYIDYITFTHEDGTVEVLACDNKNSINDFIEANMDNIGSIKAEDVFRYFKEYIHRDLKFDNVNSYMQNKDYNNKAVVDDDEIVRIEQEKMENYRKTYSIPGDIEVSVDQNGERLYRLSNGLFKFNTVNGERVMQTLKQPVLTDTKDMENVDTLEVSETNIESQDRNQYGSDISSTSLDDIPLIQENAFDENDFTYITSKRDIYEMELSSEEIYRLNTYLKFLISKMNECVQNKQPVNRYVELIADYLEAPSGDTPSVLARAEEGMPISKIESELVSQYKKNKEMIKTLDLNKNKKLELQNNFNNKDGLSTIIVLLEIIILAYFVILFLSLDI